MTENRNYYLADLPVGLFCDTGVQPLSQKYFAFPVGQIKFTTCAVLSQERGVAHVTNVGRDAVDAAARRRTRWLADGEVVWS